MNSCQRTTQKLQEQSGASFMGLRQKRTQQVILTAEGATLKRLRLNSGLSMREAGYAIGKSDSYISHIETGRLDLPKKEILQRLLWIYGISNLQVFEGEVLKYKKRIFKEKRIKDSIKKLSDKKLDFLLESLNQFLLYENEK